MHFTKSLVALAACFLPLILGAPSAQPGLKIRNVETTDVLPNSYIVVYKDIDDSTYESEMASVSSLLSKRDSAFKGVGHQYNMTQFKGYQIETDQDTLNKIAESPNVDYVEKDAMANATTLISRPNAPWGLGRISHRDKGYSNYVYDSTAGAGAYVYVIDSGININHVEFGGRAVWGVNFIGNSPDTDENGHGTHCAGTIGGATFGVASRAFVVAVKVLGADGRGPVSGIIAGIDWSVRSAQNANSIGAAVLSLSLGAPYSAAFNGAASAAIRQGLIVVAAAGNDNVNVAGISPASNPDVITVGATDKSDIRAYFSNWGPLVDIFAPGVDILSAWIGSNYATNTISGTSMACPHVAGIAAYFIGLKGPANQAIMAGEIKRVATQGYVSDTAGSSNLLAYNDDGQ